LLQAGEKNSYDLRCLAADHPTTVKFEPAVSKFSLNLGQVLATQGIWINAIQYFREIVRIQPRDAEIHERLSSSAVEQAKKTAAAEISAGSRGF
jgi:hypothetical protein